jgi:hypothetical protein
MLTTLFVALTVALTGQTNGKAPATLPDTPQGKQIAAYIKAFNAGEKEFVAVHDVVMAPEMAAKVPVARRSEMFKRMSGDFGKLKVEKIVSASAQKVAFSMTMPDGATATFSFAFEEKAPFRIVSLDLDVRGGSLL